MTCRTSLIGSGEETLHTHTHTRTRTRTRLPTIQSHGLRPRAPPTSRLPSCFLNFDLRRLDWSCDLSLGCRGRRLDPPRPRPHAESKHATALIESRFRRVMSPAALVSSFTQKHQLSSMSDPRERAQLPSQQLSDTPSRSCGHSGSERTGGASRGHAPRWMAALPAGARRLLVSRPGDFPVLHLLLRALFGAASGTGERQ